MLRDLLIALSFSNICFVNVWMRFFYKEKYYIKNFPTVNSFLAMIILIISFAVLVWLGIRLARHLKNIVLFRIIKVYACLSVLYFFYRVFKDSMTIDTSLLNIIFLSIIIFLLVRRIMFKTVLTAILVLSPLVIVILGNATLGMINDYRTGDKVPPQVQVFNQNQNSPRVVWFIFDEMDQGLTFGERPSTLELPEFDRFKEQALYAVNAYPPSRSTIKSLPALINGKIVAKSIEAGASELMIRYEGAEKPVKWSEEPTIFSKIRSMRMNPVVIGYYHPYARLFDDQLNFCFWTPLRLEYVSPEDTLSANIIKQIKSFFIAPVLRFEQKQQNYYDTTEIAKITVVNPDNNLVLIHFPLPHAPYISEDQKWWYSSPKGYFGNLKLSDRAFHEICQAVKDKGLWENTTILVSSDHWFRKANKYFGKSDHRVPFLLKLAGQKETIVYEPDFNTVITHDLLLAILKKEITTPDNLVKWLDKNKIDKKI